MMSVRTAAATHLRNFTDLTWGWFWYCKTHLWCDIYGLLSNSKQEVSDFRIFILQETLLHELTSSTTVLVTGQTREVYSQSVQKVLIKVWWYLVENLKIKFFFRKQNLWRSQRDHTFSPNSSGWVWPAAHSWLLSNQELQGPVRISDFMTGPVYQLTWLIVTWELMAQNIKHSSKRR